MDARKVHELFLSQHNQKAGGTYPVNQNIILKQPVKSSNPYSRPVQIKSSTNGIKTTLGIAAIVLVIYFIYKTPINKTYYISRQRRRQKEQESSDKDRMLEKSIPGIKPSNDYPTL
jgi:hypothetical protein